MKTEIISTQLDDNNEVDSHRLFDEITNRISDEDSHASRPKVVIFGAGGDGTAHLVGNLIMSPQGRQAGLPDIPFVPLALGNANDIARSLNGHSSPQRILSHGRQAGLQPLEITVNNDAPRYAFGYFSAGGTAEAAMRLDAMKGKHGASQIPREIITAWTATADYPSFKYQSHRHEPYITITDVVCARADRIAKFGRPRTHLTADTFQFQPESSGGRLRVAAKMVALGMHALSGEQVHNVHMSFASPTPNRQPLPIQFDGEAELIAWGSDVHVRIAPDSYTTLTTRL